MSDRPIEPRSTNDPGQPPRRPEGADRPVRRRPDDRTPTSSRTILGVSIIGALAVIALVAVVIGSGGGSGQGVTNSTSTTAAASGTATTVPGTTLPESELTTYVDDDAGFTVKYPKNWDRYGSKDPSDQLIAAERPRGDERPGNGVIIRLFRTEVPTTSENLENIRTFTDGVVGDVPSATVLQRAREININGMPGYFYLYTFTDETTGRDGAHGHYFLFRGTKAYQLIVEAIPTEGYARLAQVFDQIGESFKSDPDTAPATGTGTTTTITP